MAFLKRLWTSLRRLDRREAGILLGIALLGAGGWGFIEIADEVIEGETAPIDERILLAMRAPGDRADPIGPKWVEELGRDFTALGGVGVLTGITLAAAGFLMLERKRRTAFFLVACVGGGILISFALKRGFDRPRPDLVPHESFVYTTSFPSGHAMMAAVAYFTMAALLAGAHRRRRVKVYVMTLAAGIVGLVGISRVYVGVHWPTDVLAGWTAGACWALLCWQSAALLRRRGEIEAADD